MPADPETTAALERLGDRFEQKVEQLRQDSDNSTRRLYERIDEHANASRSAIQSLSTQSAVLTNQLASHEAQDERRFNDIDTQLDSIETKIGDGERDRGKLWSWIIALSGAGGVGAAMTEGVRHLLGRGGNG